MTFAISVSTSALNHEGTSTDRTGCFVLRVLARTACSRRSLLRSVDRFAEFDELRRDLTPFYSRVRSGVGQIAPRSDQVFGGIKKQSTTLLPKGSYPMQMCIRLSFDCRAENPYGTITEPNLDVTNNCGWPPSFGIIRVTLSTGAQSMSWQRSAGYHECPVVGWTK